MTNKNIEKELKLIAELIVENMGTPIESEIIEDALQQGYKWNEFGGYVEELIEKGN